MASRRTLDYIFDLREEVVNVALAELLEQRGLGEGRYVANVIDGKVTSYSGRGGTMQ